MKLTKNKSLNSLDIKDLLFELEERYKCDISIYRILDDIFFLRPLGRKEYADLCENENLSELEKEDIVCQACVVWPEDYDFEDSPAGVATELSKAILKISYLDNIDNRSKVLYFYRNEMRKLDNQVTCMIHEAFPNIDIEEIENWGVEKTAQYMSKAEWILVNLRGLNMVMDPFVPESEKSNKEPEQDKNITQNIIEEDSSNNGPAEFIAGETIEERQKRVKTAGKEKLTPEKLAELKRRFPEINWENDAIAQNGIRALEREVDTTSAALRPLY